MDAVRSRLTAGGSVSLWLANVYLLYVMDLWVMFRRRPR